MSFEFGDAVEERAKEVAHLLDVAERHGESGDIEEAFGPLDEIISELEGALSKARSRYALLTERAGEVQDALGGDVTEERMRDA